MVWTGGREQVYDAAILKENARQTVVNLITLVEEEYKIQVNIHKNLGDSSCLPSPII